MATTEFGIRIVALGVGEFRRNVQASTSDLNHLSGAISKTTGVSSALGNTLSSVGSSIAGVGRSITIGVTAPILAMLAALLNAGIAFEDAFSGIGKTVDGVALGFEEIKAMAESELGIVITTMDEAKRAAEEMGVAFGDLTPIGQAVRDGFRDLGAELPIPINELAELGELIGQLGVDAGAIVEVTELISYLGVATELSAEDAANGLIRFKNIMLGASGDIVEFVKSAGSALVALGNASVSTEGEILNLTMRIAAAGDRAKMTAPEIMAWATTLSDLGVRAEAGGTAVSRAITEMVFAIQTGSENVATFAQVSGQSVEEFSRAFEEDASAALAHFIEKLEEGIRTGTVTKDMLEDMGLSGVRAIDIMGRLGDAMDIFEGNLATANKAWEEQIALQNEAEKRFSTMRSQIQLAKNALTDLGITVFDLVKDDLERLVASVREVVDWFQKFPPEIQATVIKVALLAAAIGPLLVVTGLLIGALAPVVTAIAAIATPAGLAGAALVALATVIGINYGDNIVALVQPAIDIFNELWAIMTQPPPSVTLPSLVQENPNFGNVPFLPEDMAAAQAPVVVDGAQIPIAERFAEALATLKTRLTELIPPELVPALQTLKSHFESIALLLGGAFLSAADVVKTTLGGSFQEVIATMTDTLTDMGLTWSDVWNGIAIIIGFVAGTIAVIIIALIGIILGLVNGIAAAIQPLAALWDEFLASFSLIVQGVIDIVTGVIAIFDGFGQAIAGVIHLVVGVITGDGQLITQGMEEIRAGVATALAGFIQAFIGVIEYFEGWISLYLTLLLGFVGSVTGFIAGFAEAVLGFFGNLYGRITGDTDNTLTYLATQFGLVTDVIPQLVDQLASAVIDTFYRMSTTAKQAISDTVESIIGYFTDLYMQLVGGSIVPDMVAEILEVISNFKDAFLGFVSDLVGQAVDKFIELGSKIGEALGSLMGGGEGGGFSLDLSIFEEAKAKIEEFKTLLSGLATTAGDAANAFMVAFATVITEQTTLVTQTFLNLWTIAVTNFLLLPPLIVQAITNMSLTIQALITELTTIITMQWTQMGTVLAEETALAAEMVLSAFAEITIGISNAIATIQTIFENLVRIVTSLFQQMISQMEAVKNANIELARNTMEYISLATNYVNGLAGAYRALAAAAAAAAAAVQEANEIIAESGGDTYDDVTGSPELKLQHPFERFEEYLKNANFNFMDTGLFGSLYSMLSGVLVPAAAGATTTTTNNTLQVGQINGSMGDEDGVNALFERWLALRERR